VRIKKAVVGKTVVGIGASKNSKIEEGANGTGGAGCGSCAEPPRVASNVFLGKGGRRDLGSMEAVRRRNSQRRSRS